ncbi:MAG: mannose-6-phosphate isomerase, class I [Bacteroidetes bacterium]|nr:mannose-6-phosphate isomerase, class I [Bacteroidota bacterium]MBS1650245.1 mannose-6-phosphate isomerase, class I [Bacteroidota bacterium]
MKDKIFKLKGKVQNYAWGGYEYIPKLLGLKNEEHKPCAEYWMGAHPSASAEIIDSEKKYSLHQLIKEYPNEFVTEKVYTQFGELPYLFKILDVKDMLSIQVHPTKNEAAKGFDAEEAAGIPINAPHRNYKDRNHKPEVMVALSEFWLLHGFKQLAELEIILEDVQEFNLLLPLFKRDGIKGLYQFVMEMNQAEIDAMLIPLIKKEISKKSLHKLDKSMPGWWVTKLYDGTTEIKNIDRGIFSIYFFNIVKIEKGGAIFQKAGIPHAYLEGQNAELMANSDNVLRGGLTPKHIDVKELMKHTLFESVVPNIMYGNNLSGVEKNYPCPVPDFGINKIELNGTDKLSALSTSFEILIAIEGGGIIYGSNKSGIAFKQGEALAILPNEEYSIVSSGKCLIFKAFVPAN